MGPAYSITPADAPPDTVPPAVTAAPVDASTGEAPQGQKTLLKIPILYIDGDEIPQDGQELKVTDDSDMDRFAVKVLPRNYHHSLASGDDACEYLQVSEGQQELFFCMISGSDNKYTCQVYLKGGELFGVISEDMTFPTPVYVLPTTYS